MRRVLIVSALCCLVTGAPDGYIYKNPIATPAVQYGNLNGLTPIGANEVPYACTHLSHHIRDGSREATAVALIQSQSTGRILNHPAHIEDSHGLETAASGIKAQTQAITLNSKIVVGAGSAIGAPYSGATQDFRTGEGYGNGPLQQLAPLAQQYIQFKPIAQQSTQGNTYAPAISRPSHGYFYSQAGSVQSNQHLHHHYYAAPDRGGAIENGIGKVPSASSAFGQKYASGYANHKSQAVPSNLFANRVLTQFNRAAAAYQPIGSAGHEPIINMASSLSVPHFDSINQFNTGSNYQHASGTYADSFAHNTHGPQQKFSAASYTQPQYVSSLFSDHSSDIFNGTYSASSGSSHILNGQLGNIIRETFSKAPLDPSIEKHIYVHVPPEDLDERASAISQNFPQVAPKKHYKIIFIKAPTEAAPNDAQLAAAAAQQTEEKTLIYVLVKKPDEPSFKQVQQIQQSAVKSHKPEVYFIKYKIRKDDASAASAYTGPAFGSITQYNSEGQFGTVDGAEHKLLIPSEDYSSDGDAAIDIRLNVGESSSVSNSPTSYATLAAQSQSAVDNSPKHELYGVPLE